MLEKVYTFWLFTIIENINGSGGELMAYNPTQNLLDFDDDMMFLDPTSPVTNTTGDTSANGLYASDSIDLEDNKTSLLDSLTNDVNTS